MLRSSLFMASAVLLSTAAFAQNDASSKLRPVTSPVKNAGTYHVATGAWTRAKAPTANLGPDTIYNNTCDDQRAVGRRRHGGAPLLPGSVSGPRESPSRQL